MSAPSGNKYAEKWTYEKTMDRLCAIEYASHDDTFLYLNHVFDHIGLYDDVWAYWRRKWQRRPEVLQMMKLIMQRFEVRLFTKMAKKEIPERVAMFALKHHYGWGKEPVDGKNPPTSDVLAYVDQQLIEEPKPQHNAENADQKSEPVQQKPETTSAETLSSAERVGHVKNAPTALFGADFKRKLSGYNQAHPEHPVSRPASYFIGTPPLGLDAIVYDGGYFVTQEMLTEALG